MFFGELPGILYPYFPPVTLAAPALIRACEMANENLEVAENEKEFDGLADGRRP